jgi:hypothetical protein
MIRRFLTVTVATVLALLVTGTAAQAANPHESQNNPIRCVLNADNSVTCAGTVVGLGNQVVTARVEADFACATRRSGHQPGGHLQSDSEPIATRNGQITFSETAGPARCPRGLNPVVGDTATVTLFSSSGEALFTKRVPIQS